MQVALCGSFLWRALWRVLLFGVWGVNMPEGAGVCRWVWRLASDASRVALDARGGVGIGRTCHGR
jgi:hypothetical protein